MYVQFLNGKKFIGATSFRVNPNVMQVVGAGLNECGFTLHLDNDVLFGNYSDFKYLYSKIGNREYQYTNIAP